MLTKTLKCMLYMHNFSLLLHSPFYMLRSRPHKWEWSSAVCPTLSSYWIKCFHLDHCPAVFISDRTVEWKQWWSQLLSLIMTWVGLDASCLCNSRLWQLDVLVRKVSTLLPGSTVYISQLGSLNSLRPETNRQGVEIPSWQESLILIIRRTKTSDTQLGWDDT